MGIDELSLLGRPHCGHIGPDENVVDVFRPREADKEHHHESDERADEARAKFDEMIDQRRAEASISSSAVVIYVFSPVFPAAASGAVVLPASAASSTAALIDSGRVDHRRHGR